MALALPKLCGTVCDELLLQLGGWNELSHGARHPLPERATSCPRGRPQTILWLLAARRVKLLGCSPAP